MKHTNKTIALVLVLVLMLTSVASVFAYSAKAYTSGGNLNIWSDPEKIGKGKDYIIKTVKNGTALEITETGKNKAGVKWGYEATYGGYVRLGYVANLSKGKSAKAEPVGALVDVKVITSGGDLNIWTSPDKIGSGKVYIVDSVEKGDKILNVQYLQEKQANGKYKMLDYAEVQDEKGNVIGYVRTKYIYAPPAAKKIAVPAKAAEVPAAVAAAGLPIGKNAKLGKFGDAKLGNCADESGPFSLWIEPYKIGNGKDYHAPGFSENLKRGDDLGFVQLFKDQDHEDGGYGVVFDYEGNVLGYIRSKYVVFK